MIAGFVNVHLEPMVPLVVFNANRTTLPIDAMIDTGFNGYLTLPPDMIAYLGLIRTMQQNTTLASGASHLVNVYEADILWDGRTLKVEVQEVDVPPLIGAALLQGYDLHIEFISLGAVTIQARTP